MKLEKTALLPSKYEVLKEVVNDYPGILSSATELVFKLDQHQKEWGIILRDLRAYALQNFYLHDHHEKGVEAIGIIIDAFIEALHSIDRNIQEAAVDGLLFYIDKILSDVDQDLLKYSEVLPNCFHRLLNLPDPQFFLFTVNPRQIKKLAKKVLEKMPQDFEVTALNKLLFRYLLTTYEYWLQEEDPFVSFKRRMGHALSEREYKGIEELFYPVSHANLRGLITYLNTLKKSGDDVSIGRLKELLALQGYLQVVGFYQDIIAPLTRIGEKSKNPSITMGYFSQIMETKGLSSIHEDVLREMSRAVSNILAEEPGQAKLILPEAFIVLERSFALYPDAVLYCIQSTGKKIYSFGDSDLAEWFIRKVIAVGFQYPKVEGLTDEWQVRSNKAHLKNIRTWLDLIGNNPKWSKSLISALIINLRLGGVQINDTDLFQKDVTQLLNGDIEPVYHFIKQLAKVFPVYFNEINAEGELRDVSTAIDDATKTADPLIHFLRKFCHVESSSLIVDLTQDTITFFLTKDKRPLERFLPWYVYDRIEASGPFVSELNKIFTHLFTTDKIRRVTDLLDLTYEDIHELTADISDVSEGEKKRAYLAIRFYQLLDRKYRLSHLNILGDLRFAGQICLPDAGAISAALENGDAFQRLEEILNYLQRLKDIILSPEHYEAVEDVYRKRHIAAGIPSVYGRYIEKKFNALSLTYRLENMANILFEELINSIDHKFITRATLFKIEKCIKLFLKALQMDGISSNRLENMLELLSGALQETGFSFSQYIDIFRGFSEGVQDILNTHYGGIHKNNLRTIILQMGRENILPKYSGLSGKQGDFEFINIVSERFLREVMSGSCGLQQLDNFISNVLKTLFEQAEGLDVHDLNLLLSYDPEKALSGIHSFNSRTNDRIHLGNKAYNLVKLGSLDIRVPPGFIITTEVCHCMPVINVFDHARDHLNMGIEEHMHFLEELTGKKYGDPHNPLLVSVRSGAAVSMPGMMNSFLNVGINEPIITGLIKQTAKPWFAWDCYRRFLQCWGMFFGIERDRFDSIIDFFKKKFDVGLKIQFTHEQMKAVALAYHEAITSAGIAVSDDPKIQLETAIRLVFQSWNSPRAQTYRAIMGISENWGTAVTVQAMVYGNLDFDSGTGVLFTSNPRDPSDKAMLWGDFAVGAQGEDIVSGLVKTLSISNEQRGIEKRTSDISLEDRFPKIYGTLLKIVKDLIYREKWGAQEIEFTFEGEEKENLYILQARDMDVTKREDLTAFVPSAELSSSYLSSGIGVSGGAIGGEVVFDLDDVKEFRGKDPSIPLILVRSDTVPEDISFISAADGLLTARGGATSHASIIAKKLGKTCIVGCNNLSVLEHEKKFKLAGRTVTVGEFLSIDGRTGSIYIGKHNIEEIKVLTE
ncbi:MAG: PEP/pyruvate-binding domain-containing protein [Dissulfurispiraceae bacterium]